MRRKRKAITHTVACRDIRTDPTHDSRGPRGYHPSSRLPNERSHYLPIAPSSCVLQRPPSCCRLGQLRYGLPRSRVCVSSGCITSVSVSRVARQLGSILVLVGERSRDSVSRRLVVNVVNCSISQSRRRPVTDTTSRLEKQATLLSPDEVTTFVFTDTFLLYRSD